MVFEKVREHLVDILLCNEEDIIIQFFYVFRKYPQG